MKKILYLLISIALFGGCEEEIPIEQLNTYTEKLVVNEVFNNHTPFSIQISNSKSAYYDKNPEILGPETITEINLKDGDNNVIPLTFDQFSRTYFSGELPLPGKSYKLLINSKNFTNVNSTGFLPLKINNMNSTWIENGGIDMQGNKSDLLKVTFTDDKNSKDYYKINFMYYSELVDKFNSFEFKLNDILSAVSTIKTRDGGLLFSDETFNGESKTITAIPPAGLVKANTTYKYLISIEKLSSEYWKYYTSLEMYRGGSSGSSGTDLFRGATVIYSNINNGLGIFAGTSIKADTLK
ncbi:MAG: DUF4249 domain-containing protein [Bacteroidetes bacterium]|nr:DUF4249 domain-containing protein [Bacteroidota bacterium]